MKPCRMPHLRLMLAGAFVEELASHSHHQPMVPVRRWAHSDGDTAVPPAFGHRPGRGCRLAETGGSLLMDKFELAPQLILRQVATDPNHLLEPFGLADFDNDLIRINPSDWRRAVIKQRRDVRLPACRPRLWDPLARTPGKAKW